MWVFSSLSCSLMSLLASRTHEWRSWTISEGGVGELSPENIQWVELCLDIDGDLKSLRSKNLQQDFALEMYQNAQLASNSALKLSAGEWKLVWNSDKFLSEVDRNELPKLKTKQEWKFVRGSLIKPSIYVQD